MKVNPKEWFIRRNKCIAGYLALVIFIIIVIWSIFQSDKIVSIQNLKNKQNTRTIGFNNDICVAVIEDNKCIITCTDVDETKIQEAIVTASEKCNDNTKLSLKIVNSFKKIRVIEENWLKILPKKFQVFKLEFSNCPLTTINESAFSSEVFQNLTDLTLDNTELSILDTKTFKQFSQVQTLTVRYAEFFNIDVQADLLKDFNDLVTLQIQRCLNYDHLLKITGIDAEESRLPSLITIDFRYNKFHTLKNRSFVKAGKKLLALHLSNSLIQRIEPDAFYNLKLLQGLHLENNSLTTLVETTFQSIHHNTHNNGSIYLSGNEWVCNCSLRWLRDLYVHEKSTINKDSSMLCDDKTNFPDAAFECATTTGNPIETTTLMSSPSTEDSTTGDPIKTTLPTTKPNTCENVDKEIPLESKIIITKNIRVRKVPINILVIHVEDTINTFLQMTSPNDKIYKLFWFNTLDHNESKCINNLSDVVPMKDWKYRGIYTICLLDDDDSLVVDPFSCAGINVPEDWSNRSWIVNKYRTATITIASVAIAAAIIFSGAGVFFLIRHYPNLLKGSKRIVMVGSRVTSAVVMPEQYSKPNYTASPVSGYMTPNFPIYDSIHSRGSSRRQRSYSDTSNDGYVNPNFNHFVFRRNSPTTERFICENESAPPPLPPFHPKMKNSAL